MINKYTLSCIYQIPVRFTLAIMIFTACLFSYMLRVNMSINLIAMVQPTINSVSGKVHVPECLISNNETIDREINATVPNYGPRYNWDQKTQGLILGAYFWGYIFTGIPGGLFAERWGARQLIGIVGIISAILTILIPFVTSLHYGIIIVIRFITGLANGVIFPALHNLISRWVPPDEKGIFSGVLLGGNLGTVITWPFLAAIAEFWGWNWAFFIPGLLVLIWVVVWYLLVYDTPDLHPRIKEDERKYIEMKLVGCLNKEKRLPPYKQIFSSPAFYSLIFLHFGNCWGLWLMVTTGPKYLSEVLGLKLSGVGSLATLPHLARVLCAFGFGAVADLIRKRGWMTVTAMRKVFVIFSHFIPGILILIQPEMGCNITLAILLLTLSLGLNGACTVTNIQNSHDLAPNFAGSLYGIINCIGTTTGFITPMLAGYFIQNENGLAEWKKVFTLGAIIYIASGVVFCVFGSGEIQPWNEFHANNEAKLDKGQENAAFEQTENTNDNSDVVLENTKV